MRRLLSILFLFLALDSSIGQTIAGPYPHGTFDNRGFDSINTGNLNAHFSIPIVNKPGRGLSFYYNLSYDSTLWFPSGITGITQWTPKQNFGWIADTATITGYVTYQTEAYPEILTQHVGGHDFYLNCWNYVYQPFVYVDTNGVEHRFWGQTADNRNCEGQSGTNSPNLSTTATDGSGYKITVTNYTDVVITSPSGTTFIPPVNTTGGSGMITDANGNQISTSGNGVFVDTLGVNALTVGGSGTASSPTSLTYNVTRQPDSSPIATATVSYVTRTVRTNFGCSGVAEYGPQASDLVDRVTLADGTFYSFSYESTPGFGGMVTGRLASVTLPTGGTIAYQYSGGCNGNGLNGDSSIGGFSRSTTEGTRSYIREPIIGGSQTKVQDEKGNWSQYQFVTANDFMFETHRQIYQGGITGTPLLDQSTCYNGTQTSCDGVAITLPISQTHVTSSYNGGTQLVVNHVYNPSGSETSTAYLSGGSSLQSLHTDYNSLELPIMRSMLDGNGNTVTYTSYGYDELPLIATSGIPQHVSVSGPRGNLTSVHTSAGSVYLDTSTSYYDTGVPGSSTTPNGTTSFTYDSTQTWVTNTALPTPPSGIPLSMGASYDAASGVQLASAGMNGEQTQTLQYERLLRPKTVSLPDGGQVNYDRTSANELVTTQSMGNGQNAVTVTLLDGYGRTSRTAIANGSADANANWYQVDFCYDATGLLQFQSLRYAGPGWIGAKRCSGDGTSYSYDALGRVTTITDGDGTSSVEYMGRAIKSTDANGVQKITQYDLLGRIASICEVVSPNASMPGTSSPEACQMDIAGTGFRTVYSYSTNIPNRVTTIQQGSQTRSTEIDPAGRTIKIVEPERGTTSYSYTYNSTGLSVTRTRPRANQTNPSLTTNTVYQYDRIGRLTEINYGDGTPTRSFFYDSVGSWPSNFTQANLKGRLVLAYATAQNYGTVTGYSYDVMGRVAAMRTCLPTLCGDQTHDKSLAFGYDLAGNLTSEFDGASGTISYGRSPAGEVTSITNLSYQDAYNPPSLVSGIQNGPYGPTLYNLGNGRSVQNWYDSMGRLIQQVVCGTANASNCFNNQIYGTWSDFHGARVTTECNTVNYSGGCASFGYDALDRLSSMSTPNYSYSYEYDRYGNRWSQNVTAGQGIAHQDSFDTSNHMNGRSYDAAGNMTNDGVHSYAYDAEGNLTQVDGGMTASNNYDAFNHRVWTQTASVTYGWLFDYADRRISGWLMPIDFGNQGRIYWGSKQIAYRAWNGTTYFQHQNINGTDRMRTDYTGAIASTYISLPFGDGYSANETSSQGDGLDPAHFAMLDHDGESNTDHAMFRQYSSGQGRWMSPDPYDGSYDMSDPQSFNRYSYVKNRPLSAIDPLGLSDCDFTEGEAAYLACVYGGNSPKGGGGGVQQSVTVTTTPLPPPARIDMSFILTSILGGFGNGSSNAGSNTGGASAPTPAPKNGFSLSHIAACSLAAPVLGAAKVTNRTAGVGVGGSFGAGIILGLFASAGVQIVADPQGNAGLAFNVSSGAFGAGVGAQVGGQISLSTARNIGDLRGGPAGDFSGSASIVGLDVAHSPGGATTGTVMIGPGVGGKTATFAAAYTGIPLSTNCKDMFPK